VTPEETALLIQAVLGVEAARVERQPYGHANVTYDVTLPDGGRVIARTNRRNPASMAGYQLNHRALADLGLPVPTLIASDLTCGRFDAAWMLLERIPGRDLGFELGGMTRPQMTRLAEQIVEFQRRAAALPSPGGYGWTALDTPARHTTWRAVLDWELEKNVKEAGPLAPPDAADRIRTQLDRFDADFAAIPSKVYLDDLTTKNVIVEDGEFRGVVDFNWIGLGDPRYWLGLTSMAVTSDTPPDGQFYLGELHRVWGSSERDRAIVALYAAMFALDFLEHLNPSSSPGQGLARGRILAALATYLGLVEAFAGP